MNCTEVMTLMQRQLDHDLDELEHSLLTEHTSQCPACAEMFERLTMLHDDLEMLPKVTPRYSLVDAILPQLDEIDRRNSDQQAAALAPLDSEVIYKQEQSDNVQPSTPTKQPAPGLWKRRFNWRAASAVVAAGVVFGLFMVNYQHTNSSESADFNALQQQAKLDQYTQSSGQKGTQQSEHAYQLDEEKDALSQDKRASAQGDQSEGTPQLPSTSTSPDGSSVPVDSDSSRQDNRQLPSKANKETVPTANNPKHKVTTPAPETSKPPVHDDKEKSSEQERGLLPGDKDKGKGTVDKDKDQSSGAMSFLKINDVIEAASPDQLFVVKWQANKLSLFSGVEEKSKEIQTITLEMKPVSIQWSDDSKQILITLNDGQEQQKLLAYAISEQGMVSMDPVLFTPSTLTNKQSHSDSHPSDTQDDTAKQPPVEAGEGTSSSPTGG
ncbi:anti-sigma factor family protein [Paenibacillus taiwanensis]|uniref:anti-sigma factor family protein n=1 Tax=Paenibacillus taiwanensis TaxID=401638 RepID=UPI0003F68B1F|nr:zf-HC2 domain-containing protein [Paenibacillus taiwanensis]